MNAFTKMASAAAVALALSAGASAHAATLTTFANFSDNVNGPATFKFTNNTTHSPKASFTGTGVGTFSFDFANFLGVQPSVFGNLTGVKMTLSAMANTPLVNQMGTLEQAIDDGVGQVGTLKFSTGTDNLLTITFHNAQLWGSAGSFNFKGSDDASTGSSVTFTSDYVDFTDPHFAPNTDNFAISLTTRANVTTGRNGLLNSFTAHGTGSANIGVVPEPASWALMILGFGGVGASIRNRRRQALSVA